MARVLRHSQETGYEKGGRARRIGLFSQKIAESRSASHNFCRPAFWPADSLLTGHSGYLSPFSGTLLAAVAAVSAFARVRPPNATSTTNVRSGGALVASARGEV